MQSSMLSITALPSESSSLTVSCMENAQNAPYLSWVTLADRVTNLEALGLVLYTHYFLHFILAAMLLLVAMILVIVLTGFKHEYMKHQDLFEQMNRSTDEA